MVATEYMCIMVQGFWEKEMGKKKKKKRFLFLHQVWPSSLTNDFPGRSYRELEKIILSKSFVKSKKKKKNLKKNQFARKLPYWDLLSHCSKYNIEYEILFDIFGILQIG